MLNDTCISFSDDNRDEFPLPGKKKTRIPSICRRKCRKLGFRGGKYDSVCRILIRWWPLLVLLPAVGLLIFEASKLGTKRPAIARTGEKSVVPEKELDTNNLDRLDPVTRVVNGVRQSCLKLLPPDTLKHLDIPLGKETESPVRRVIYKSDDHASYLGGNTTLLQRNAEAGRFNSFTGSQTMSEREKSFEVNETVEVHCGFYSEDGGFKISDEDKNYMKTCKVVVSTCTFGGGDDLYQPIGMSDAALTKVCYVAFWDDITLATQEESGKKIGEDHMIGKWRIVIVKDLPFTDQRLNGKIPKMLSHRLFPQARYSIWVDSKSQFRRDPLGVLEALLWRTNSVLAISEHGARSSVYDEGKAVVTKHKATPEEVDVQLTQYRRDRLPNDKRFNGKKALSEASVIVRENMPMTNLFMCLWFNEVVRFTSRDQLSFPYVLWRLNPKNINMFPVCTRRDLVNSIGHIRKAKPLIN